MKKYDEFDKKLLDLIKAGKNKMALLEEDDDLRALAKQHQNADRYGDPVPVFRVIDRRLQALRQRGKLWFNGTRWEVVKP